MLLLHPILTESHFILTAFLKTIWFCSPFNVNYVVKLSQCCFNDGYFPRPQRHEFLLQTSNLWSSLFIILCFSTAMYTSSWSESCTIQGNIIQENEEWSLRRETMASWVHECLAAGPLTPPAGVQPQGIGCYYRWDILCGPTSLALDYTSAPRRDAQHGGK